MKRNVFKMIAGVISVSLLLSCAGCGEKDSKATDSSDVKINETGYPISDEPITVSVFGSRSSSQTNWENMLFFQEMEKMTNVHMEFTTPPADTISERKNLAFASNELPDVFFGVNFEATELLTYASEGQIIPIDGYIDKYAPNLKKILDENPDMRRDLTTTDGHIYALSTLSTAKTNFNHFFINQQWLKNLGLETPTTIDEYTDVLRAFKNGDPNGNGKADEIPLSLAKSWQVNWLAGAFGIWPHDNGIYVDGDEIKYGFTDERFREYLGWLHQLYSEGLLDSASFTQDSSQINAKGNDGVLGSFFGAINVNQTVGNDLAPQYDFLAPLTGPHGDRNWIKEPSVKSRFSFVITKNCKCPEAMIRWVDYLYSMEGAYMFTFGVEGKTYTKLDDGYYQFNVPEQYSTKTEFRCKEISPADGSIPMISGDWREYGKVMKEDLDYFEVLDRQTEIYDDCAKVRYPILYFDGNKSKEITSISTDLGNYVQNMHARFIIGDASLDKDWEEYCATIKKIGVDKFVSLYQEALDARNSKQ